MLILFKRRRNCLGIVSSRDDQSILLDNMVFFSCFIIYKNLFGFEMQTDSCKSQYIVALSRDRCNYTLVEAEKIHFFDLNNIYIYIPVTLRF